MGFTLLGILNSQAAGAGGAGAYDLLETTELTSSASSVSFTGLDSYTDYKHLQIRMTARSTRAGENIDGVGLQFNSDTGSNYADHYLRGNGSTVSSSADSNQTDITLLHLPAANNSADIFGAMVIDILDFSSASKNTTTKTFSGVNGAAEFVYLQSGLYVNTAAITSLNMFCLFGTSPEFGTNSRFSLYGIKG